MNKFLNHLKRFKFNEFNSKEYNNEKAIISFTSWKKRIDYVYKTLETLISQTIKCHIVLVLSSDEFPQKEKELPQSLLRLHRYFELLWVKENYKAFKKVLFTMDKYRNVPVISADDDLIYKVNYAERLYSVWEKNKDKSITYKYSGIYSTWGFATLFPPYCFGELPLRMLKKMLPEIEKNNLFCDDAFYSFLRRKIDSKVMSLDSMDIYNTHKTNGDSISNIRRKKRNVKINLENYL